MTRTATIAAMLAAMLVPLALAPQARGANPTSDEMNDVTNEVFDEPVACSKLADSAERYLCEREELSGGALRENPPPDRKPKKDAPPPAEPQD